MHRLRTARLKRPILWIAVLALLLSAISSQLRVTTCIGDCCASEVTASEVTTCSQSQEGPTGTHTSCDCCDESSEELPCDDDPLGESRGACMPGCCLTMDFDIEMAPIDVPVELPLTLALALPPTQQSFAPMPTREFERLRPFDRGPPRIDRSTALRVCTVLLI